MFWICSVVTLISLPFRLPPQRLPFASANRKRLREELFLNECVPLPSILDKAFKGEL